MLSVQVTKLEGAVEKLQGRLKLNSRNSSKPPSSDGLNKPAPKSLRVAGQKPTGGHKSHTGNTLRKSATPDKIVIHGVPELCQACQKQLPSAYVAETRQVFDLPEVKCEVTEHQTMQAVCGCGHVHTGEFPAGASAAVQYGPRAQAAMVHLNENHAIPLQRTAALMEDFFGLPVSQATVSKRLLQVQKFCSLQWMLSAKPLSIQPCCMPTKPAYGLTKNPIGCMCWPQTY